MNSVPQSNIEVKGLRGPGYEVKKAPVRYRRKQTKSGLVIVIRLMSNFRQIGKSTMLAERVMYELNIN